MRGHITIMQGRSIAFGISTGVVTLETAVGAYLDLMKIPFVRTEMIQLGYPEYMLTVMGVWKVSGLLVLLAPGLPRLKEWVYAGLFFLFSGAAVSHLAVGQYPAAVGPAVLALFTMASRALHPVFRRSERVRISGF